MSTSYHRFYAHAEEPETKLRLKGGQRLCVKISQRPHQLALRCGGVLSLVTDLIAFCRVNCFDMMFRWLIKLHQMTEDIMRQKGIRAD
eukprot:scaffold34901_cov59-Attheya_sp.AAC.1